VSLEFTPHILPLLGAALLAVLLLPNAWKNRRDPIALWFGATLVALFVWSVGYTLEIMAVQVLDKIFLANLQFLGVPAIIVCWWEMIRRHVGMRPVSRPITATLWLVPISTVIVAFWNPAHLFRVAPHIESGRTPFPVLHADYGPWYWWVLVPFMSLVTLASLFLLARALLHSDRFHRRQHALLLVAFLLPLVGSYLYMFDLSPWQDYNPAVALSGLSCLLVAVALFRCQLFAMVPLAREKVVEDLGDPVIVIDRLGRLVDLNRSAERVTGVELRSTIARPAAQVLHAHPQLVEMLKSPPSSSADDAESTDMTVEGPGSPRHFAVTCSPVTTDKGDYLGKVLVMHDVTEREKLLEQTRELANRDDLTGLPNRRHFFELTEREYERARRHRIPLTFLLMDVDHFKGVNDTFGHRMGDQLLQELAGVCRTTLRTSDLLGRVGGEEFAVLLPETGIEDAIEVADRLREVVESLRVTADPGDAIIAVTASMGLAQLHHGRLNEQETFQTLYERADRALYAAKRSGRNVVVASRETSGLLAAV
jgi:diguanylate cyclase (GGDEF)-like protein/PAS domain S-box-containing protein